MRLIIAGTRSAPDLAAEAVAASGFALGADGLLIVSQVFDGGAPGADAHGAAWARRTGIPVRQFKADWGRHGKAAGPIRNEAMAREADALVVIWDGASRGTQHMIAVARRRGLRVYVHRYEVDRA